jgi:hypothetical protein
VTAKPTEKPRKSTLPHPARRHIPIAPSASRFAAPPTARFVPAKSVGSFVPTLTKKAFEKFGFSTATLVTDWTRIAGAELASYTSPDRLKWPRAPEANVADGDESERRGATLILRVDPARALDVEYRARQIMDRINAYFGYRAVETIRLIQAPLDAKPARPDAHAPTLNSRSLSAAPAAPQPTDDPLVAALARLEKGVLRNTVTRGS